MASHKETFVAKWTEPLTNLLVSLLVDEIKKGNRTTCTYNKAGWNNILTEFNKKTALQFSLVQLKNRVNKLKRQFGSFKKLLSQSGFGWDNINKTVVVEDPSVWEAHIKDNSEWAKFRKDGFPQYPELCIVFGDTYATGKFATRNAENLVVLDGEDNGGGTHGNGGGSGNGDGDGNGGGAPMVGDQEELNEHPNDEGVFTPDVTVTPIREKHKLNRTPNPKRRRKNHIHDVSTACKAIQDIIKSMTQSTSDSVTSHASPPQDPYSVGAVIAVLNDMPDLEQNLYNKAVNQACINGTWREAFIISLPHRRRGLLESL